jgi:hypothetical protein
MKQFWNEKEEQFLRSHYGTIVGCHIAQILGRSEKSIQQKAATLDLCHRKKRLRDTLCWFCQNAGGRCSWSSRFIPVENWRAVPTYIANDNQSSFIVKGCPQFIANEIIGLNKRGIK